MDSLKALDPNRPIREADISACARCQAKLAILIEGFMRADWAPYRDAVTWLRQHTHSLLHAWCRHVVLISRRWHKADITVVLNHVRFWG